MPFWSDLLRSVTPQREDLRAPSASGAQAPVGNGSSDVPGAAAERVRERVVGTADRAPADRAPAVRAPTDRMLADRVLADRVLVDPAPEAMRFASEPETVDRSGLWQARALDLVTDGLLLFGAGGELAYRNAAATSMTDDDGMPLLREARALALLVLARSGDRRAPSLVATRELTVGAVHFHLAGVCTPASLAPGSLPPTACAPAVLVTIARTSPPLPSPAVLRHQFQLTAREASVALLLAEGRSNAGVARRLGISANTVRHYIETVLLKLDVPSRAAVAAALLGVYERTDEHALPRIARSRRPPDAD